MRILGIEFGKKVGDKMFETDKLCSKEEQDPDE